MKKMPNVLAIFLPQFYETEDNNKWWGQGFTDWESVKQNKSYFAGHYSPWVPKGNNYYDLSKPETLKSQALLANKYGIDGFCFYHYYFKNEKKELELPAENLLKHKEIDISFCFNWANESWIRSWSKFSGNIWGEGLSEEKDGTTGVLALQDYGDELQWRRHFEYLMPFFMDERYIKIQNKPLFIIYRPEDIKCADNMITAWNKWAEEIGFDGIYFVGANSSSVGSKFDAAIKYEPRTSFNILNEQNCVLSKNHIRCYKYKDICNSERLIKPFSGCKTFFSGVVGYDDTARRGENAECIIERTPALFQESVEQLLRKSIAYGNEFLLINAWNEWGEGMYLEPDERDDEAYLNALLCAKKNVERNIDDIQKISEEETNDEIYSLKHDVRKFKSFSEILSKWLTLQISNNISFKKYFELNSINSVAIYGLGVLGRQLYSALQAEGIDIKFCIDRYVGNVGSECKTYRIEDKIPDADLVVVTIFDAEDVKSDIEGRLNTRVIMIEDIINYYWEKQ